MRAIALVMIIRSDRCKILNDFLRVFRLSSTRFTATDLECQRKVAK